MLNGAGLLLLSKFLIENLKYFSKQLINNQVQDFYRN